MLNVPINALRPHMWERVVDGKFYIGDFYVGSFEGNNTDGYMVTFDGLHGYAWAPTITRALRKLRIDYWARKGMYPEHATRLLGGN